MCTERVAGREHTVGSACTVCTGTLLHHLPRTLPNAVRNSDLLTTMAAYVPAESA
jgi:hypothetical protein